jgi:ribosomal protein S18 acetylase RimI-like enzyme
VRLVRTFFIFAKPYPRHSMQPNLSDYLDAFHPRAPNDADAVFLARLYASTRSDLHSITADPAFVASIIEMQQRLQAAGYRQAFPGAEYLVLAWQGAPIGRIVVDISERELLLVDIAILPELRGQGLGSRILRALQQCAAGRALALALSVHHSNPQARRLYLALGFEPGARGELSERMIWNNGAAAPPNRSI